MLSCEFIAYKVEAEDIVVWLIILFLPQDKYTGLSLHLTSSLPSFPASTCSHFWTVGTCNNEQAMGYWL